MCIAAHTSVAPPDIDYWSLIAAAGKDGATGAPGVTGLKGDTGATGADSTVAGPAGPAGATGAIGPKGDTGDQGIQGENGEVGPPAMSGYEVIKTDIPVDYEPVTVNCSDINKVVIGGGCSMTSASLTSLHDNYPVYGNQMNGWHCSTNAEPPYRGNLHAFVICMDRQ